jgi:hypothetical protein
LSSNHLHFIVFSQVTRALRTTKILIGSLKEEIRAVEVGMIHSRVAVQKAEKRRDTLRRGHLVHVPGLAEEIDVKGRKHLVQSEEELDEKREIIRLLKEELEALQAEMARLEAENDRLAKLLESLRPPPEIPPPQEPSKPKPPAFGPSLRTKRDVQRKFTMNLKAEDMSAFVNGRPPKLEVIKEAVATKPVAVKPKERVREKPQKEAHTTKAYSKAPVGAGTVVEGEIRTRRASVVQVGLGGPFRLPHAPSGTDPVGLTGVKEGDEGDDDGDDDGDGDGDSDNEGQGGNDAIGEPTAPRGTRSGSRGGIAPPLRPQFQTLQATRDALGLALPTPARRIDSFRKLVPTYSWTTKLFDVDSW